MDGSKMKTAQQKAEASVGAPPAEPPRQPAADEDVFTGFVQALVDRSEDLNARAEAMMTKLRKRLLGEIRRRSVWSGLPCYVGVYGYAAWTTDESGPLAELVQDCYTFLFDDNLARLAAHLKNSGAIDGLVVAYLKVFVRQRRQDHDPLGYHLFGIVNRAVRDAVASGELHVRKGPENVRNETILSTDPDGDPRQASSEADLYPVVARWNSALMPELLTAQGHDIRKVRESLLRHLVDIEAEGIEVFSFKALIDAVKNDVRRRVAFSEEAETVVQEEDGHREVVQIFRPENRQDEIERFRRLIACVTDGIQKLDRQRRTIRHLERLWTYLRRVAQYEEKQALPSMRQLEGILKISRDRLPKLLDTMRGLMRHCRGDASGTVVNIGDRRPHA